RGQALPRGRALLRVAGAGDRLRLLAPRRGSGQRVVDRRGAAGQRRARQGDRTRGAAAAGEPARVRLRQRGGARHHDIARGDSRGGAGTAEGALREVLVSNAESSLLVVGSVAFDSVETATDKRVE